MKLHVLLSFALFFAVGCSDKDKKADPPAPPAKVTTTTDQTPKAPAPMTGEQKAARHKECMGFFSAQDADKFKGCMAADVTVEMVDSGMPAATGPDAAVEQVKGFWAAFPDLKNVPQLILVNGNTTVSIEYISGTNTGEFMGMPASNKKVGYLMAHVIDFNDEGKATKVQGFADMGTLMGQLGHNPAPHRAAMESGLGEEKIVVAADSQQEKDNLALTQAGVAGVNAQDRAAFSASLSDDSFESDQTAPADIKGKAEIAKHIEGFFTAFPDVKLTVTRELAAGDYVANVGTFTGKNTGDMPAWGLKKTGKDINVQYLEIMKVADGKVTETWRFWNGMAMAMQLGLIPPPDAPATK